MEEAPLPLVVFNLTIIFWSAAALVFAANRLLKGQPLAPYSARLPNDPGGVLSRLVGRSNPIADFNEASEAAATAQPSLWQRIASDVGLGLAGFLTMFLPVLGLQAMLVKMWKEYQHPLIDDLTANPSISRFAAGTIAAVVIAPVLEEFIFRNCLQGGLEVIERRVVHAEGWSYGVIPILLSSLLFAGVHWTHGPAAIPLFFFALMLGYLYYQTHRLLPVITAHAALNLFSMIQLAFFAFGNKS